MDDQDAADRYEVVANRLWSGRPVSASYLVEVLNDSYDVIRAEALDFIIEIGARNEFEELVQNLNARDQSVLVSNRLRLVYGIYKIYDEKFRDILPLVSDEDIVWHYAARFSETHDEFYKNIVTALGRSNDMRIKSLSVNIFKLIK